MHGGNDLGAAARAQLRDQLAHDYDASFPEIVGKEVKNYRDREQAWQEPNKCATLTFSPPSTMLTLRENDMGQFTAQITAAEGAGHAKALADLSGQANATFTPSHAEGDPAAFSYTVTSAGGGKQVSATVRATSKAGVARDTWVQNTVKPLPPPPAFTGPISGTAEYDSHELGDGNSLSASWSGNVELQQTTSQYPPGYPGSPTAVYKIRSGIIQYAYNGHVGGCTVVGSGPMDLASQPDIKDSVLLQLYDGSPRTYQFQIGMPLLLTIHGTKSQCDNPDDNGTDFAWNPAGGVPWLVNAPLPGGVMGEDWAFAGNGEGNSGDGSPDQTWTWSEAPTT
jgi:hypothetical protein